MTRRVISATIVLAGLIAGCSSTVFKSETPAEHGRCESRCQSWGMRLASKVSMGHLTSGCVCENAGGRSTLGAIGASPGIVGKR